MAVYQSLSEQAMRMQTSSTYDFGQSSTRPGRGSGPFGSTGSVAGSTTAMQASQPVPVPQSIVTTSTDSVHRSHPYKSTSEGTEGHGATAILEEESAPNFGYDDPEADFTLISSDGVSCNIHKYYLLAASSVFREMLDCNVNTAGGSTTVSPTLTLSDAALEESHTLRLFLDLITGMTPATTQTNYNKLMPVYDLAQKYDCPSTILLIKLHARKLLDHPMVSPEYMYVFASHVDDVTLAADVIRHGAGWRIQFPNEEQTQRRWRPDWYNNWETTNALPEETVKVDTLKRDRGGEAALELSAWPLSMVERLRSRYLVSLIRAMRANSGRNANGTIPNREWDDIARAWNETMKGEAGQPMRAQTVLFGPCSQSNSS